MLTTYRNHTLPFYKLCWKLQNCWKIYKLLYIIWSMDILFHFAQFIVPYTGFLSKIKRDENISTLFLWEQLWKKQPQRISHKKFKEPSSTVVFPFFSDDKTDSTKVCFTPYCKNKLLKQENMTTIDQPPHVHHQTGLWLWLL